MLESFSLRPSSSSVSNAYRLGAVGVSTVKWSDVDKINQRRPHRLRKPQTEPFFLACLGPGEWMDLFKVSLNSSAHTSQPISFPTRHQQTAVPLLHCNKGGLLVANRKGPATLKQHAANAGAGF